MTRKYFFRILLIAFLAIAAIPAALRLTRPARMPETAAAQSQTAVLGANAAALVRDIENNLIAPCCWNQPISEHPSEISDFMRAEVRDMVAEGKNRDEILDYYVAKYGERILAAPRARGVNALAYVAPFTALILGGWSLFLFRGKKRVHAPPGADPSQSPEDNSRYYNIIEKELRELDD